MDSQIDQLSQHLDELVIDTNEENNSIISSDIQDNIDINNEVREIVYNIIDNIENKEQLKIFGSYTSNELKEEIKKKKNIIKYRKLPTLINERINLMIKFKHLFNHLKLKNKNNKRGISSITEKAHMKYLKYNINNETELGLKIKKDYKDKFNKNLIDICCENTGGRNKKFDCYCVEDDDNKRKCEFKGTKNKNLSNEKPWGNNVQFINYPGNNKLLIMKYYSNYWYHNIIPKLYEELSMNEEIPNKEDYINEIIQQTNNPILLFIKELKNKYKNNDDFRKIIQGKRESINNYIYNIYHNENEIKNNLINELQDIINDCLSQKECYFQYSYDDNNEIIKYKWWDKIEIENIHDIKLKNKIDKDLIFEIECHNIIIDNIKHDNFIFEGKLRWGASIGIKNLRFGVY